MIITYLQEVSLDDFKSNDVIPLDKEHKWVIDPNGEYLRHIKLLFKTDKIQSNICSTYRYYDPTKTHTDCIKVHLCITKNGKEYAMTTLRKLDYKCMIKHWSTYSNVPKDILRKAIKYTNKLSEDEKKELLKMVDSLDRSKPDKEKPKLIKSIADLKK